MLSESEQPYLDEAQKELGEEALQQAEVVSHGGQDGVDGIAIGAGITCSRSR